MREAVKKYAGVDFDGIETAEEAKALAKEHHIEFEERHGKGDILNLFFETYVEEKLVQPTFIMDHPVEVSPLTKRKPDKPEQVERFELFIYGREMCNAYSELNDPIDQRERFKAQEAALAAGDEEATSNSEKSASIPATDTALPDFPLFIPIAFPFPANRHRPLKPLGKTRQPYRVYSFRSRCYL